MAQPPIPDIRRRAPAHAAVQVAGCLTTRKPHANAVEHAVVCRARALSNQAAISVPNGRVWVCLSVRRRGGRQAARARQRTKERKVNTLCLLFVYFLITAHLVAIVYLAMVVFNAAMSRPSCVPCGRVPPVTANPFFCSVLPLSQTYQGHSHTPFKVCTNNICR